MSQSPYIFGKVKKLPAKYATILLPLIISIFMSGIVSAINILHRVGWSEHFFKIWLSSWGFSWMFAFPAVLLILPIARRIVGLVVDFSAQSK